MATIKSLKQLRAVGGIVSKEPVKCHIEWKSFDSETGEDVDYDADIFVVKQGAGAVMEIYSDSAKEQITLFLSKAVMMPEGESGKLQFISFDDAYHLDPPLRNAMWEACQKLAGIVRKNSPPSTSSSASSSPAESAAAP